jgi:hypothetical protein
LGRRRLFPAGHGLEHEAASVGEKKSIGVRDALLGNEDQEFGQEGSDVLGSVEECAAFEKYFAVYAGLLFTDLLGLALMNDAETGGVAEEGIGAAVSVGGGEATAASVVYTIGNFGFFGCFLNLG